MDGIALIDGVVMPIDQATIPITDPAFTVGWAVFETLRSDGAGKLRKVDAHLERLASSAEDAAIDLAPLTVLREELERAAAALDCPARIRVTVSGSGRRVVTAVPLDPERFHKPVRAARGTHRDEPYLGGAVKQTSRAPWIAAVRKSGVDEVLLVDRSGRFTEGTTCAVLAVVDGVLFTAPHDGRILESTTCVDVLERAAQLGVEIRREGPQAAGPWDALYVASTTRQLAPVVELDGEPLPAWDRVGRLLVAPS